MELGLGGLHPQRQSSAVLSIEAMSTPHDSVFFLMVAAPLPCVSAAAPGQGLNRYLPVDLIAQILAALSKNVRAPITQWWWFWKIEDAHPRVASPLCA